MSIFCNCSEQCSKKLDETSNFNETRLYRDLQHKADAYFSMCCLDKRIKKSEVLKETARQISIIFAKIRQIDLPIDEIIRLYRDLQHKADAYLSMCCLDERIKEFEVPQETARQISIIFAKIRQIDLPIDEIIKLLSMIDGCFNKSNALPTETRESGVCESEPPTKRVKIGN